MQDIALQFLRSKYAITILVCGIVVLSVFTFGNWNNKILSLNHKHCRCKNFVEITKSQIEDQKELDKIDPISGLTNRETIFKRHPNLGRQVLSEAPRCNLIPYITK